MILGIGSDLIDINRIEKAIERFGQRFIDRCFTKEEIEKAESRCGGDARIATYAKRFAAKEACSKALGTGYANGVYFRDIGVVNDKWGRPTLHLKNGACKRLGDMTPDGHESVIHLTMTDEPPLAQAYVIIECRGV